MKFKPNPLITDLVGEKTTKLDSRVAFFGACDELSCHLMEVRCLVKDQTLKNELETIVSTLSIMMGEVALGKSKIKEEHLEELLKLVEKYQINFGIVTKFVLPGQNEVSSRIHIARCVARRAELAYAKVYDEHGGSDIIFEYLNKISTLLYAIALRHEDEKLIENM